MNCLLNDIKRAFFSFGFLSAVLIQYILLRSNQDAGYKLTIPLVCTFPYANAWLTEYRSGFVNLVLHRTKTVWYIAGKYIACIFAGGLCEVIPALIDFYQRNDSGNYEGGMLLFLESAIWAGCAALLSSVTGSKCCGYGGSFIIFHFFVILYERYWTGFYYLNPYEWLSPNCIWFLDTFGLKLMLSAIILWIGLIYAIVIERKMKHD